jgi:hypothetical protein
MSYQFNNPGLAWEGRFPACRGRPKGSPADGAALFRPIYGKEYGGLNLELPDIKPWAGFYPPIVHDICHIYLFLFFLKFFIEHDEIADSVILPTKGHTS